MAELETSEIAVHICSVALQRLCRANSYIFRRFCSFQVIFFSVLVLGYRDQTDFPSMASFVYLVFGGSGALSSKNVSSVLSTGNCLTINRAMQGRTQ